MPTSSGSLPRRWQDKINLALAVLLLVSPWLFGYVDVSKAAGNAWIMGAIFLVGSAAALMRLPLLIEWFVGFFGLWTFLAPRILAFTESAPATATQMAIGAAVGVLAVWSAVSANHARLAEGEASAVRP